MKLQWSDEQRALIDAVRAGRRSVVAPALAGSGKSATATAAIMAAPEALRWGGAVAVAYNKAAAEELGRKLTGSRVAAKTLHGLGYGILHKAGLATKPVDSFPWAMEAAASTVPGWAGLPYDMRTMIARAVRAGITAAKNVLAAPEDVLRLVQVKIDVPAILRERHIEEPEIASAVIAGLEAAKMRVSAKKGMDFDDMIWAPIVLQLTNPSVGLLLVDELQDANPARLELARRVIRPGGRILAVGDPNQRIYGWADAVKDACGQIAREYNAEICPLTITWRCPTRVVDIAATIVPEYRARPGAAPGTVVRVEDLNEAVPYFGPGAVFVARTNTRVVAGALACIRAGIPAVLGGAADLAQRMQNMLTAAGLPRTASAAEAISAARRVVRIEIETAREDGADSKADALSDAFGALEEIVEGAPTVADALDTIRTLVRGPGQAGDAVHCMTVHGAKGLEAHTVIVDMDSLRDGPQLSEEANIAYVALSRAQDTEVCVGTGPAHLAQAVRRAAESA